MRKLVMACALAAAALVAHGARADDAADKAQKAGREAKGEVKEGAARAEQAGDRAVQGTGAERGSMGTQARSQGQEKKHPTFEGKDNFEIEGKVQKASRSSITIQREELPPAELQVSKNTKIELDGQQASMQQLKQGQDVKASFNMNRDKAEAVEIKAEKTDAQERRQEQQR